MVLNHPLSPFSYNSLSSLDQIQECATSLQEEGERALLEGDSSGLLFLEEAAKLSPTSHELLFRQGLALFEFGSRKSSLSALRKGAYKFKCATDLNPFFCEAWHSWANTLAFISKFSGRTKELLESKDKIDQALGLLASSSQEISSELYWDAGLIYYQLAESSGEMDDLLKAIAHFEKSSKDFMPPEFWNDFGKAYADFSDRLQDIRPVFKAVQCFKQAVSQSFVNIDSWIGLGRSLKRLYQFTRQNDHLQQAYDCFVAATELKPSCLELWVERIEFLIEGARLKNEPAKLNLALEKCQQAFAPALKLEEMKTSVDPSRWIKDLAEQESQKNVPASPSYIHLLGLWAEALALLGQWNDQIELIYQAEQKIDQAFELIDQDDPLVLLLHGKCLYSFAKYYHDLDLYHQAIEQFQASLSIDRTQIQGWIWMGKTYATIFDCIEDIGALEKALYFYHKALQLKTDPSIYFEIAALLIHKGDLHHDIKSVEQAVQYLEYLFQAYKSVCYDYPEWFFQYGLALDLLGDLKEEPALHQKALEVFVNVLMFSPEHQFIHHRIGIVYLNLGESLEEVDYFYRSLHHFRLAERAIPDQETLYIDWGITWLALAEHATDASMEESCLREAEQKLIYAAKLGSLQVFYQLACLYSLQRSFELSLDYLHKAHSAKTLPPFEELQDDAWLEGVRLSPGFQEFLALLQKN